MTVLEGRGNRPGNISKSSKLISPLSTICYKIGIALNHLLSYHSHFLKGCQRLDTTVRSQTNYGKHYKYIYMLCSENASIWSTFLTLQKHIAKRISREQVIHEWLIFAPLLFRSSWKINLFDISTCIDSSSFGHYAPDITHLLL